MAHCAVVSTRVSQTAGLAVATAAVMLAAVMAAMGQAPAPPPKPKAAPPAAPAAKPTGKPAPAPGKAAIERQPYRIRAVVRFDPALRLGPATQRDLVTRWRQRLQRLVGPPWLIELADAPPALAGIDTPTLTPATAAPVAAGADQLWLIELAPAAQGSWRLRGRAYSAALGWLGPIHERIERAPADAVRGLVDLARNVFQPEAEIQDGGPAGGARLLVRGGALPTGNAADAVARKGQLYLALRELQKPDGSRDRIAPVPWTYLKVDTVQNGRADCQIVSSLRDPLTRRVLGRSRLVAVGVQATGGPLRLRFETRAQPPQPVAGYTVTVRESREGRASVAGLTDREGRFTLIPPPDLPGLVLVRLLAADTEPLAEFPVLPGETADERTIRVDTRNEAVALEMNVATIVDQIVDLIAQRSRLASLIDARITGNAWDEVATLLDQYRKLPPRAILEKQLATLRDEASRRQAEEKIPILTSTAQARLGEAETLIQQYLDDDLFRAFETALADAKAGAVALPGPNWKPFEPPGAGFRVVMPGDPRPSPSGLTLGAEGVLARTSQSSEENVVYVAGATPAVGNAPGTPASRLEQARQAILSRSPSSRLISQREVTRAGLPATELVLDLPTEKDQSLRVRTVVFVLPEGALGVLSALGPPDRMDEPAVETFFNSVSLPKRAPAPAPAKPATPPPAPEPAKKAPAPTAGATPF